MLLNNLWLTCAYPNPGARGRLFCFPYGGGGASAFRHWSQALPPALEIFAVQLPGRENRLAESPYTRLTPLVEALALAVRPYLDKPFAFFGHSFGALISFELARYLRLHEGMLPRRLFVSARPAPQVPDEKKNIHQLPDDQFIARLRRYRGTPEAVLGDSELMQLLIPTLRADFSANETYIYTPEQPLACPISAFGGYQDREVSQESLAAWEDQTNRDFRLQMFPGDHFFLQSAHTFLMRAIWRDIKNIVQ